MTNNKYIPCLLLLTVVCFPGIIAAIRGGQAQAGPIAFRTSSSKLTYIFPKTETSSKAVIIVGFSTPKCTGKLLDIPSRDIQEHFYKLTLISATELVFDYQVLDGLFSLTLKAPRTKSFCDGHPHHVILQKDGSTVRYNVDGSKTFTHIEQNFIQKPSLSKPDKILIGGDQQNKFIGCLYNASIEISWSSQPTTLLDLVKMYSYGDPTVSGKDLFLRACVHRDIECSSNRTKLTVANSGWLASSVAPVQICTWELAAPQAHRVKLELYVLRVNDSCFYNHVRVMEGQFEDKQVIARYCNPFLEPPIAVYSEGRHLTVTLQSLPSGNSVEFLAKFTTTGLSEGPCPVMKHLSTTKGSFWSPFFPYNYGNSRKCTWIIQVPREQHVLITFKRRDFKIDGCSKDCRCDYLGVNTKDRYSFLSYRKYCGDIPPSPIYLQQSFAVVEFNSDADESHQGFKAHYIATPSLEEQCPNYKELQSRSGVITSPRHPHPFPGEMDCFWVIKAPPRARINLTFSAPLHMDPNCTDFIEVTDSAQLKVQTLSVKLCSSTVTPVSFSTKRRKLFVRFVSDRYQRRHGGKHGFKAEYEVFSRVALKAVSGSSVVSGYYKLFPWLPLLVYSVYI